MPLLPSYVPIVQELLAFAIGGQLREQNLLVGHALGGSVPATEADSQLVLETPQGRSELVRLQRDQGPYSRWTYADTATSGVSTPAASSETRIPSSPR